MEWKEIINLLFFGGLIFFMMRFGCCGGHRYGGSRHEGHSGSARRSWAALRILSATAMAPSAMESSVRS